MSCSCLRQPIRKRYCHDPQPDPALRVHLLDADVLALLLADIARDAQLDLPESAVESAVRRGRGSARDALSALDQVVASGVVDDDRPLLRELLVALVDRDTTRALQVVESALVSGRDAPRIASELLEELRASFLTAVAPVCPAKVSRRRLRRPCPNCPCSVRLGACGRWRCWNCARGDERRPRRPDHPRGCHRAPQPPGGRRRSECADRTDRAPRTPHPELTVPIAASPPPPPPPPPPPAASTPKPAPLTPAP